MFEMLAAALIGAAPVTPVTQDQVQQFVDCYVTEATFHGAVDHAQQDGTLLSLDELVVLKEYIDLHTGELREEVAVYFSSARTVEDIRELLRADAEQEAHADDLTAGEIYSVLRSADHCIDATW